MALSAAAVDSGVMAATGGPWSEGAFIFVQIPDNKQQTTKEHVCIKRPQVGSSPVAFVPFLHNFKLASYVLEHQ
jgi:hypothetical protein